MKICCLYIETKKCNDFRNHFCSLNLGIDIIYIAIKLIGLSFREHLS